MSEVFFSTDLCRHHTFCGGVSRVDRAMAEKTRSRSPTRVPDEMAKKEASSVPPEASGPKGADEDEKLSEGKTGGLPKSDELPEASLTETIQEASEETTGRLIVDTMLAAARTLETCAGKLEASTALLENIQTDGQALQSLVAGVNYYASTTKASQASQSAQHEAVSWDWLSSPSDKTPLKETVKTIAHQSQNTSKAAFKMIEVSGNILEELKSHKAVMAEQCTILKLIASNQVEVSKMLKAVLGEEKSEVPPSGGSTVGGAPSGSTPPAFPHGLPPPASTFGNTAPTSFMPFVPPGPPQAPSVVQAKFWRFQPVVAPAYEPNESRNPPSAAYSQQDVPSKSPAYLEVFDSESNKTRAISPTGRDPQTQLAALNAAFVPKGWMMIPETGKVHRLYF